MTSQEIFLEISSLYQKNIELSNLLKLLGVLLTVDVYLPHREKWLLVKEKRNQALRRDKVEMIIKS